MNTLVIVLIAAVGLVGGYCYIRWLANKWGIDLNARHLAVRKTTDSIMFRADGSVEVFAFISSLSIWCRPCHRCYSGCCLRLGSCSSLIRSAVSSSVPLLRLW